MIEKNYIDYYPNRVAKLSNFAKHLKDRDRFDDYCNGKNEYFYKDKSNYGWKRNNEAFTYDQRLEREYLWNDFGHWVKWQESGRNIFDFSEGLLDMLKDTDVSDLDLEQIKLPYSSFYMDISKAGIPFADNYPPIIEGVFVSEEINQDDKEASFERVVSFDFAGDYINYFKDINYKLYSHVRGFHAYSLFLDRPYNLLKVGDAIKDAKDGFIKVDVTEDNDNDAKIDLYKIHADFIERTVKLVVNCLLYISLSDKDQVERYTSDLPIHLKTKLEKANTKKRKELATTEINHLGFSKIKYVGLSFKRSTDKYDRLTGQVSPHWRRGHWRNQRHGETLSLSKLVWIMPTVVNKDKGEPVKGHLYLADKKR